MNDLKPFQHGEEGTHSVCYKHSVGGNSVCCKCTGKDDCGDEPMSYKEKQFEWAEERARMRKIVQNWDGECLSLHEINNGFVAIDRFKTVILGSLDKPLTDKETL